MEKPTFYRAREDTEKFRSNRFWFWGVEVIGSGLLSGLPAWILWDRDELEGWQGFLITFGIFVLGLFLIYGLIYLWNLFRAPYRLLNEASERVDALEKEKEPRVEVKAVTGKRASYENEHKTAWAELEIKNISSVMQLEDVSVQIVELKQVYEKQDNQGKGIGIYHYSDPYPTWNTSNIYWSERNVSPSTLSISISPGAARCALIAFHLESGVALGVFNTPTKPILLESKILIEVSCRNSGIWRGAFYIEYHPVYTDKFEFVEWDKWVLSHNVI